MDLKTHEIWNIHFIEKIIDTMADGVFTLDNNGRVTSWNRSEASDPSLVEFRLTKTSPIRCLF